MDYENLNDNLDYLIKKQDEIKDLFLKVFDNKDGEKVLDYLMQMAKGGGCCFDNQNREYYRQGQIDFVDNLKRFKNINLQGE
jgi:hypothetical protein